MNTFNFVRLLYSIYGKQARLPNLEWIQRQGLLAIKLGQVHALRIDFLKRETCEHLAKLYRQTQPLAPQAFQELLNQQTPSDFKANFASLSDTPLASASVGQVHLGTLTSGESVVVKLIKSDVRKKFIQDVESVRSLLRWALFFYPKLKRVGDPIGILDDIQEYTLSELDLRHERDGQTELRSIYEAYHSTFDLSHLRFPKIYPALSNENVMVSECIPGFTFDELLEKGQLPYETMLTLFQIHGFYMFVVGTFHGDLHPGNIILSGDKLAFVDTGYIGRVGPQIRQGLFRFFEALSDYDYPACAVALNSMSMIHLEGTEWLKFRQQFLDLYKDFTHSTVAQISLTKMMMQTIKLGVLNGMTFEKGIFAIIRSLMYLDGMVLRCNPNAILMHDMRRFISDFKQHISEPA